MQMDAKLERAAAEALLDAGVSLPLKSISLPWLKSPLTLRITLRRPYLGTQIRMARRFLKMGVKYDEMRKLDKDGELQFLAAHGKSLSRLVADLLWRGRISSALFGGLTACFLRRFVDERYLLAAVTQFALLSDLSAFGNIIRLVERMNPMTPRLSH